jgi:hypothetical protein
VSAIDPRPFRFSAPHDSRSTTTSTNEPTHAPFNRPTNRTTHASPPPPPKTKTTTQGDNDNEEEEWELEEAYMDSEADAPLLGAMRAVPLYRAALLGVGMAVA